MLEIERKFLVPRPPSTTGPGSVIAQGYLASGPDDVEVRLRRKDDRRLLGVKAGAGLARTEVEVELSGEQFDALWPSTRHARIVKRRYLVEDPACAPLVIELDVFEGELAGLCLAEVEFPSVEEAGAFVAPDWFGREVTDVPAYANRELARRGRPVDG